MKRVEANDAFAMFVVGNHYMEGQLGLLKIGRKLWNYGLRPQSLGPVTHIINWVSFMKKREI
jgi:hypothetical protein